VQSYEFRQALVARGATAVAYVATYLYVFVVYAAFLLLEYGLVTLVAWTLRDEVRSSELLAHALHTARIALALTILALSVVHGVYAAIEQIKAEHRVTRAERVGA
jgi:hypothetical protein